MERAMNFERAMYASIGPLRRWLLGCLCLVVIGCAALGNRSGTAPRRPSAIVDPPAPLGAPTLLIALPNSPTFLAVRKSLVSEVRKNFKVQTVIVTPETTANDLGSAIEHAAPACIVLMNNPTMGLLSEYERQRPALQFPPTVLLMASLVEAVQPLLKNATGIAYEVPGVIAFVNLRAIINAPVRRVGVVYRPNFRKLVGRQIVLAGKEHIELIAVPLSNEVSLTSLRSALETLVAGHVDAVWMLNDNVLVRDAELRDDAWRAVVTEAKLPLVVGAANLINPSSPLGTLAVVPDHEALGLQAANLIFELQDDAWKVHGKAVELPLSVKTLVDLKTARDSFGLRATAGDHIDRALE